MSLAAEDHSSVAAAGKGVDVDPVSSATTGASAIAGTGARTFGKASAAFAMVTMRPLREQYIRCLSDENR